MLSWFMFLNILDTCYVGFCLYSNTGLANLGVSLESGQCSQDTAKFFSQGCKPRTLGCINGRVLLVLSDAPLS